jgi:hypothetical protein
VNRKLAIIEALSRPDFGCDMGQWRQRWQRWEREVKHYLPQVGSALTGAMRIAIVRQRAPEDLQKHLKLNAMVYGEQYEAFHDMIEAYIGADEDEQMDNTYNATMTASKGAAHPTVLDMMTVKRVARYLAHRQHLRWVYTVRNFSGHIEVYTDSDWGGDQKTTKHEWWHSLF